VPRLRQLKASIDAELVEAFKATCAVQGISMASRLATLMRTETGLPPEAQPARTPLSTRRQRHRAIHQCAREVERIRDAEEAYLERIPENLSGGEAYCAAEEAVAALSEAAELLREAL
jgi:hypothetical protein